ncbi:MAG: YbaN family protein [Planctomycetaceae bacterium]
MKIRSKNAEIVIDFDGDSPNLSARRLRILAAALSSVEGVSAIRLTWYGTPQIVAAYDSQREVADFLRDAAARLRSPQFDLADVSALPLPEKPVVSFRFSGVTMLEHGPADAQEPLTWRGALHRLVYGGLTCGAFAMSWVGLLVPGIPTVPFVILTVYFAEKTSPTLRRAVLNSPVLGQAMRDWHEYRAIRRSARRQALIFTGVLVVITLLLAPPSLPLYALVAIMLVISIQAILRIPVMDEEPAAPLEPSDQPMTLPLRYAGVP